MEAVAVTVVAAVVVVAVEAVAVAEEAAVVAAAAVVNVEEEVAAVVAVEVVNPARMSLLSPTPTSMTWFSTPMTSGSLNSTLHGKNLAVRERTIKSLVCVLLG